MSQLWAGARLAVAPRVEVGAHVGIARRRAIQIGDLRGGALRGASRTRRHHSVEMSLVSLVALALAGPGQRRRYVKNLYAWQREHHM